MHGNVVPSIINAPRTRAAAEDRQHPRRLGAEVVPAIEPRTESRDEIEDSAEHRARPDPDQTPMTSLSHRGPRHLRLEIAQDA